MRRPHRALLAAGAVALLAACGGDGDGDLAAFCAAATDGRQLQSVVADLDPEDVESARATFEAARDAEERLREDAPEAVRPDIDVLIRFFDDLIAGLDEGAVGGSGRPEIYEELRPQFDQVEAASGRISRYVDTNC